MIIFTRHALEKMDGLGIDKEAIKQAIARGMKWKEKERDAWHANMAEVEGVFMKEDGDIIVITVYLARMEK